MKLLRFQDPSGQIRCAAHTSDGWKTLICDMPHESEITDEDAQIERVLPPLAPHTIYGIGLNYRTHALESGMAIPQRPIAFLKPVSSAIGDGEAILLPPSSEKVDYEVELAVVIGRAAKNVNEDEALDYVLGYTVANDVSARDWQLEWGGGQWCRGKAFDTFCPLGPVLVTRDEIPDPQNLRLKTVLNGQTMQDWSTRDMIFSVAQLIAFLSHETTLHPGTVILTGTPQGVGMAQTPPVFLRDGDNITVEIEGIGALSNPVLAAVEALAV